MAKEECGHKVNNNSIVLSQLLQLA